MNQPIDYSLCLITDRPLCLGRDLFAVVEAAVAGGVTMVQLREKECSSREFVQLAKELKKRLDESNTPLIINDRLDIALLVQAHGIHVGQQDLPVQDIRSLTPPGFIIGLTTNNLDQVKQAQDQSADYLGVGPIYGTQSKKNPAPTLGIQGLQIIRANTDKPLVAIGGITPANAAPVIAAGANGLAVISALCSAPDPKQAAKKLKTEIDLARKNFN